MGGPVKGTVVAVRFPFTDLSSEKRRPALVLAELDLGDYILCQVTSRPWHEPAIELADSDFRRGSLSRTSFVRPDKVFTGNEKLIVRELGRVTDEKLSQVQETLIEILR